MSGARRWGTYRSCPAFTLIEMVVSLSVVSIVFTAMGSVMLLATKAIPSPDAPVSLMIDAADILEQMASELQIATSVTAATDKGITFTVPDRDNDAVDETISYLWDGTAGTPFCRQYNGGAWVAVMPGIRGFNMAYDTLETSTPGDPVTSDEVLLVSHDPPQESRGLKVDDDKWIGQCIVPLNLPGDALSWSVTSVCVRLKYTNYYSPDNFQVQMRMANADHTPSDTTLVTYTMSESLLASYYNWWNFPFSINDLSPDDELCLVIKTDEHDACHIEFDNKSGGGRLHTDGEEDDWKLNDNKSMVFYVYGTYTSPGPEVASFTLRSVSMTLAPGSDPASLARASAGTLNTPVMP
jgi:prepilin-type N-terminal cleavage/methylation domain-containing protein